MRVLLLGGTGFLGRRCIQALLAHGHTLTVYVRNPTKLQELVSPEVLDAIDAVVVGDATNASQIAAALREHDIEAVVNTAGNQVFPFKEMLLPKIARAICDATVLVGKERGAPLRIWLVGGINILKHPVTGKDLNEFLGIAVSIDAHTAVRDVVTSYSLAELRWSLICVAQMSPLNPGFAPFKLAAFKPDKNGTVKLLAEPRPHNLMLKADTLPTWEDTWLINIPWIGAFLNVMVVILTQFGTIYEDVAEVLAGDLASGSDEWEGKRVGMKDVRKLKST